MDHSTKGRSGELAHAETLTQAIARRQAEWQEREIAALPSSTGGPLTDDQVVWRVRASFFLPAERAPQRPLDRDSAGLLARLWIAPPPTTLALYARMKGGNAPSHVAYVAQAVETRCGYFHPVPVAASLRVFLCGVLESPADLVMYLSYAVWQGARAGRTHLDLDAFTETFPDGLWDESDRKALWDAQKIPARENDNGLDHPAVIAWLNRLWEERPRV